MKNEEHRDLETCLGCYTGSKWYSWDLNSYSVCDYLQERYGIAGVRNDDGGRLQGGGSGRISGVRNEIGKDGDMDQVLREPCKGAN